MRLLVIEVFARLHQDFEDPTKRTRSFALKWRSGKEPQIGAEEDGPGHLDKVQSCHQDVEEEDRKTGLKVRCFV